MPDDILEIYLQSVVTESLEELLRAAAKVPDVPNESEGNDGEEACRGIEQQAVEFSEA